MKTIFMLTKSNFRKSKSHAIGLVLLIAIAAMFLYMGLVLYFGMGDFFDERAEQLNAPHYTVFTNHPERINLIQNFEGVADVEVQRVIAGLGGVEGAFEGFSIMAFARF